MLKKINESKEKEVDTGQSVTKGFQENTPKWNQETEIKAGQ